MRLHFAFFVSFVLFVFYSQFSWMTAPEAVAHLAPIHGQPPSLSLGR